MPIFITREEESSGPYTFDDVRALLAEGSLLSTDLAWHEGLEQWIPLSELVGQSTVPESVRLPSVSIVVEPVSTEQVPGVTVVNPRSRKELLIGICVGVSVLVIAGAVWFGFFRPDGSNQEELRIAHVGEPKEKESFKLGPSKTNTTVVPVNSQSVETNTPVVPVNPRPVETNALVVPVNPRPVETNAPVVPVNPRPVETNATAGPVNQAENKPPPPIPNYLAMIRSHDVSLDFYVIDIGSDRGLKKGQKLTVFRDGKNVGEIEVTRVNPTVSIVVSALPKPSSPFKLGDKVR